MADDEPMKRWADGPAANPEEARAAAAMKVAAQIPARAVHAGDWDDVLLRASKPGRAWPALAVAAIAMLIAVAAGLGWQRYTQPTLSASREARVVVGDDGVVLSLGRLEVTSHSRVKLATPHVSLMVEGRVAADVDENSTRVHVYEGVAIVRADREVVELGAGQSGQWPTPPPLPQSLLDEAPAPTSGACDERPAAERDGCLLEASRTDGLAAQVALFERASRQAKQDPHAAEALWRESLRRFPTGTLQPEVRLNLLRQLLEERRFAAAVREALEFELACGDDPRGEDVRQLRRALEGRLNGP